MGFQDPGDVFQVKHLLLSYIDVQLKRFLPDISENEARQRGLCRRRANSPKPFNDGSRDIVFWAEAWHIPVDELKEVQVDEAMVQRKDIQLSNYFPGAWVPARQTPPPQPSVVALTCGWKRPRVVDNPEGLDRCSTCRAQSSSHHCCRQSTSFLAESPQLRAGRPPADCRDREDLILYSPAPKL